MERTQNLIWRRKKQGGGGGGELKKGTEEDKVREKEPHEEVTGGRTTEFIKSEAGRREGGKARKETRDKIHT